MSSMASLMAIMALILAVAPTDAEEYAVGDGEGWNLGVNYEDWVSGKNFRIGDTLLFEYNSSHSVEEVSQFDYDSCTTSSPYATYNDRHTTISLTYATTRYFICGTYGHCGLGMKLAVPVSGSRNPAAGAGGGVYVSVVFVAMLLMGFLG